MPATSRQKDLFAAIGALALVALLVAAAWLGFGSLRKEQQEAQRHARELAQLPGLPGAQPLAAPVPMTPDDARARNAATPFLKGPITPAVSFRFSGTPQDMSRAVQCLAQAALAEAGPSDSGQRAVIQVVLNRVRHPAFARTVCGVVFEGSERVTGCQFTFTCDGSLARRYGGASWETARQRAAEALAGKVYAPVGLATHYHTDWVYPYWSPSLTKLARVDTHLFFRWPGYWGSKAALRVPYRGGEPDVAQLLAQAEIVPEADLPMPDLPPDTPAVSGGMVAMRDPSGRANFVTLEPGIDPAGALAIARTLCREAMTCRVLGWASRADIPAAFPLPPTARASLLFSFTRDPGGSEIALYDCTRFAGLPREQCIPRAR
jgi:spore germination cell wall hydrolase CwlJ-like protein